MKNLPLNDKCFVTSITLAALKELGPDSLSWEPEIVRDAFEASFDIPKLSQKMFDKLNCGYMLVGTNAFSASLEGFLPATAIMNNIPFEADTIPFCTLEQCAWSVWEYINLIGAIENGQSTEEFCSDIAVYLQEAGNLNGVSQFPVWLSFAQKNVTMPDLTGDAALFEMYNARQQNYIQDMTGFVNVKQAELSTELLTLQKAGIIGEKD